LPAMEKTLLTEATAEKAGILAFEHHRCLRALHPWLPEKSADEFVSRILWMIRNGGGVHAAWEGEDLRAFLGWFPLDDYRNEGKCSFTPDWCVGAVESVNAIQRLRILLREVLGELYGKGIRIHGVAVPAHRDDLRLAFDLSGYGRIVMDAARPTHGLLAALNAAGPVDSGLVIRRAGLDDAADLAAFDRELARHIAAPPVLMPRTRSGTPADWKTWLTEKGTAAYLALRKGAPIGFIKAQEPQMDVTFTVHGSATLAINGMFVIGEERGKGAGPALLRALAVGAMESEKTLISVDCETMNPEAYGFWTRFFITVSWSMERRFTT
jgi:predicted acetyltransferase